VPGTDPLPRTAWVLGLYILGLWAYCAVHVLSRAFYSLHDTRSPVRIAVTMTGLNLALNLVLVWPMREAGLALATAISSSCNALWLGHRLRRRLRAPRRRELASSAVRSLVAAVLAGGACSVMAEFLRGIVGADVTGQLLHVFVPMALALAVFVFAALVMHMKEPRELVLALRRSRRGEKPAV